MNNEQFQNYVQRFEKEVMIPLFETGGIKVIKLNISTRPSRLFKTEFGQLLGCGFEYDRILALNYYGMMKPSFGFTEQVKKLKLEGFTVHSVVTPVVYFASVRLIDIKKYSQDLTMDFSDFKEKLVEMRWNRLKERTVTSRSK